MSTFDRFANIMRAEINNMLADMERELQMQPAPPQTAEETLAQAKRETAAFIAEETRAKRALDEAQAEIEKYFELAKKAVEANNMGDARTFITAKQELEAKVDSLEATYLAAKDNADKMRALYKELEAQVQAMREGAKAPAADAAKDAQKPKEDSLEALVAKYAGPAADAVERELEAIKRDLKNMNE